MIWVRRYVGYVAALLSVVITINAMVVLHYLMWRHFPSPLAYVTGIPNIGSAPIWVHTWNIMLGGLPAVIVFRWINSISWRARMNWRDALAMWVAAGGLTYLLGWSVTTGVLNVNMALVAALAIVLTLGFYWLALLFREPRSAGQIA